MVLLGREDDDRGRGRVLGRELTRGFAPGLDPSNFLRRLGVKGWNRWLGRRVAVVVVVVAVVVVVLKGDEDSCRPSTSAPHFQWRDRDVKSGHRKSIHMCKLKNRT